MMKQHLVTLELRINLPEHINLYDYVWDELCATEEVVGGYIIATETKELE